MDILIEGLICLSYLRYLLYIESQAFYHGCGAWRQSIRLNGEGLSTAKHL